MNATRRDTLKSLAAGTALAALGLRARPLRAQDAPAAPALKGNIRQGACGGAFGKGMTLEQKCELCVRLGLKGMDFVGQGDWPTLKRHGLVCTLASGHGPLSRGFNRQENHAECLASLRKNIEAAAAAGYRNVVCFSGNRGGLDDASGATACVEGLKQIAAFAEEKQVTLCMELLNSKRNHPDYQCDRTAWGADVCRRVGSPRVKLLYDIYHMQVQEGDVIATLREFMPYIGHIHTAGVPGRHELGDAQELNYPAIMRALVELKYDGFVSHEYTPLKDAAASLAEAVRICDV